MQKQEKETEMNFTFDKSEGNGTGNENQDNDVGRARLGLGLVLEAGGDGLSAWQTGCLHKIFVEWMGSLLKSTGDIIEAPNEILLKAEFRTDFRPERLWD